MTKWLLLAGNCVGGPFGVFSLDPDNGPSGTMTLVSEGRDKRGAESLSRDHTAFKRPRWDPNQSPIPSPSSSHHLAAGKTTDGCCFYLPSVPKLVPAAEHS